MSIRRLLQSPRARRGIAASAIVLSLGGLVLFRAPVDAFFDGVMVMAEDDRVKSNRLALLTQVAGLFANIADFTHIAA